MSKRGASSAPQRQAFGDRRLLCSAAKFSAVLASRALACLRACPVGSEDTLYRRLFDEAAIGIYRSSADGRPVFSNQAFAKMMGFVSVEEWLASDTDIERDWYVDPHRRAVFVETIERAGSVTNFVSEIYKRANGERIWVSETARVLRDAAGRPLFYEGTIEDITSRIRAAEELSAAKEAAERASRVKSDFLAHMSHELRTPLNGMLGTAELLAATKLDRRQRHYADVLLCSGESLLAIINDILDSAKIEAGHTELRAEPFDLRAQCEDIARMLAARAAEKGVELVLFFPPNARTRFVGDGLRLRQVVLNLAGNAVKFTKKGLVLISVDIENRADSSAVRIAVRDTGIGIDPSAQARIFERFEQADASTTRTFGGTGLGLSISRQMTELMGGEIQLQSEPGAGSEFTVSLELRHAPYSPTAQAPPSAPLGRILIADGVEPNRRLLRAHVLARGGEVTEAINGAAAVAAAEEAAVRGKAFQAVFIQDGASTFDGAAAALRNLPSTAESRIVLLSPADSAFAPESAKASNIDDVLVKPLLAAPICSVLDGLSAEPPADLDAKRSSTQPEGRTAGASQRPIAVLLVEDNSVNRLVAGAMLRPMGVTVVEAEDGCAAVEACRNAAFDLILMDVSMPQMDGLEATRAIRTIEIEAGRARTPIVGLSARAFDENRRQCLEAGMDDYLTKPVRRDALKAAIKTWTVRDQDARAPLQLARDSATDD